MEGNRAAILIAAQLGSFLFALISTRSALSPSLWMATGVLENLLWLLTYLLLCNRSDRHWRFLPLVPVVFLLLLDWHSPFESDPIRYEWDGRALLAGINPWTSPPAGTGFAPELISRMNFPELATIYSPISILLFAASAWLGDLTSLGFLALLRVIHFTAAWWALRSLRLGWLWLLHPLLLREGLANAHPDLLLGVALLGLSRVRHPFAAVLAACTATLIKLPGLLLAVTSRRPLFSVAWATIVLAGGFTLIQVMQGGALSSTHSLLRFGTQWEANSGWFRWIRDALFEWVDSTSFEGASLYARLITGAAFVISAAILVRSAARPLFWVFFLLPWLSPVANAWYFLWSLFLMAGLPAVVPAHLVLFALLPLSDAQWLHQYVLAPEAWPVTTWLRDHVGAAALWNIEHLVISGALISVLMQQGRQAHLRSFKDQS